MANETPRAGDCIIFENAQGSHDVSMVLADGTHKSVRAGLLTLDQAHHVAIANLESGRILVCHHSAPDAFELFS